MAFASTPFPPRTVGRQTLAQHRRARRLATCPNRNQKWRGAPQTGGHHRQPAKPHENDTRPGPHQGGRCRGHGHNTPGRRRWPWAHNHPRAAVRPRHLARLMHSIPGQAAPAMPPPAHRRHSDPGRAAPAAQPPKAPGRTEGAAPRAVGPCARDHRRWRWQGVWKQREHARSAQIRLAGAWIRRRRSRIRRRRGRIRPQRPAARRRQG